MKLQSKKARVPIAALGVTALIAGAGALTSPAFGAGETLAFGPTATSATIVNSNASVTPGTSTGTAGLTYGLKVTGASGSDPSYLSVLTAPTGAALYSERVASNGTPTANATFTGVVDVTPGAVTISTTAGSTAATAGTAPVPALSNALIRIGTGASAEYVVASSSGTAVTLAQPAISTQATVALATAGAAASNDFFVPTLAGTSATMPGYAAGDNVYFGAIVPGDYTFKIFQDHNGNRSYDAAQDDSTPTFTLHVKDVTTETSTTSDDLNFGLTVPSTSGVGQAVLATATMGGLTTSDTRGGTTLADKIALATSFAYTGTATGQTNTGAPTFATSTHYTRSSGTVTAAGTVITTATLGTTGTATATTSVAGNGVTGVTLAASDVVGSVAVDATTSTTTNVKTGTAAVTYTATVANSTTATDIIGKTVYFTLGGTDVASLTTNGTTIDAASHIYSAVTNSSGVASLTVTDGATTPDTYTVAAKSNNISQTGIVRTALYADAEATTASVTNTDAELTPTVSSGVSVTLKGKLMDQFGALFMPALAANQVVTVTSPAGVTTICSSPISAGTFSCVYTPSTTPTAGTSTTFRFAYTGGANPVANGSINWASNTPAATVTLTSPTAIVAGANLSTHSTISPGQSVATTGATNGADADDFGDVNGQITGTVYDASNLPLAFKSVTLTGGTGVYFSTAASPGSTTADDFATTLTVVTNSSGMFSGGYAFFTKVGTVNVTATSGAVSDLAEVTTDASSSPYFVTDNDATGTPGATLIVTGTVKDAFLNPVPNTTVDLGIGTSTLGAFGNNSPTTNADGVYSTTFTSGSNQSGTATMTATLHGLTENPVPVVGYLNNAGLTIAHGEYMDTATITLSTVKLTLSATEKITSGVHGGISTLTGTSVPSSSVLIYGKPSGSLSYQLIDTVEVDEAGDWSATETIDKSTYFFARSGDGLSSASALTKVYSRVGSISAKALGKGKVSIYANGDPNALGTLTFYRSVAGPDVKLKTITSSTFGSGRVTVKLPAGNRTVYAKYKAPGTSTGTSKKIRVKVK